jgi:hypothetical protein
MAISRWIVLGSLLATSICWQSASGAPIDMPAGSKVWMKFDAAVCPDGDLDDCIASNQAGPNPPNGIPLSTFGSGGSLGTATGFAEILPDRIRIYSRGEFSNFLHASFEDSYTVVGSAAGPFDIPVEFHVSGMAHSIPAGPFHQLIAFGEAEIGVFNTSTDGAFNEGQRVQPFDAQSSASFAIPFESTSSPFSRPIDVTARYTVQDVNVGDTFTLAFGMNWRSSKGEGDLLNSGIISFDLPEGVFLTSALAESLQPLPGDYNLDGTVDAADYVVWRKTDSGNPEGYTVWQENFGEGMGGSGSAGASPSQTGVPEPTTLVLLMFAATGWCLRRGGPHGKYQHLLDAWR